MGTNRENVKLASGAGLNLLFFHKTGTVDPRYNDIAFVLKASAIVKNEFAVVKNSLTQHNDISYFIVEHMF